MTKTQLLESGSGYGQSEDATKRVHFVPALRRRHLIYMTSDAPVFLAGIPG